jgi:hypothetical protein
MSKAQEIEDLRHLDPFNPSVEKLERVVQLGVDAYTVAMSQPPR